MLKLMNEQYYDHLTQSLRQVQQRWGKSHLGGDLLVKFFTFLNNSFFSKYREREYKNIFQKVKVRKKIVTKHKEQKIPAPQIGQTDYAKAFIVCVSIAFAIAVYLVWNNSKQ